MTTNISIVDDYTLSLVSPQPVVGIFAIGGVAPVAPAPVEDAPAADENAASDEDATAKVVKAPRRKAEPKTTEGVETK